MQAEFASSPLIGANELRERLAQQPNRPPSIQMDVFGDTDARVVVIDTSFDLADRDAGEKAYQQAHIPGAHYLHLERDLSGVKTGSNGRHPLPDRGVFAAKLGALGVAPGVLVVALDRHGGPYAARLWWLLRWMGHAEVKVLDGGWSAWLDAGGGTSDAQPAQPGWPLYPARDPARPTFDAERLLSQLGSLRVIDARAAERFRGEVEPLDAIAGHIPGASHRFFKTNLGADGRFKSAQQLRQEFQILLGQTSAENTVHQCGSGVTACHNLLSMEIAGLPGSQLYPGSWSEWCSDPERPVAIGG